MVREGGLILTFLTHFLIDSRQAKDAGPQV
jgi:hypothetical protein